MKPNSAIILEYLKVFFAWPFLLFVLLIVWRKEISRFIDRLKLKTAKGFGLELGFTDSIEEQSKIASTLETIEKENPGMLEKAGLDIDDYRRKVKKRISLVQEFLKERKYYDDKIDGIPGTNTKKAVRQFQKEFGLDQDGLIGPKTVQKILELQHHNSSSN